MGRPDPQIKDAIFAHLRGHHPSMCRHWFDEIEPVELAGGTLKLLVLAPAEAVARTAAHGFPPPQTAAHR